MPDQNHDAQSPATRREVTVISADRDLDFTSAPALEHAITAGLGGGSPHVVVDFSHTRFMDSSGINALLRGHRSVVAAGGWIRLSGVSEPVLGTMEIVGLPEVISIYPSVDLACADL
jgi:anti-sigma B factor antagonist